MTQISKEDLDKLISFTKELNSMVQSGCTSKDELEMVIVNISEIIEGLEG